MKKQATLSIKRWFYGIDNGILVGVLALMFLGFLTVFIAGPYTARRIGAEGYIFLKKFGVYSIIGLFSLFFFSKLDIKKILILSIIGLVVFWSGTVATFFIGSTIKGAKRWINVAGFGLQPSELMKPFFIIIQAYLLQKITENWKNNFTLAKKLLVLHLGILALTILPLIFQPDLGMAFTFLFVWGIMVFIAGLPWKYVASLLAICSASLFLLYNSFGHFKSRIDRFWSPENADTYQIDKALEAVKNGGWLPNIGDGFIKESLPDSHADFVFVVFVEEFGALIGFGIIALFLFVFLTGMRAVKKSKNDFVIFSGSGLLGIFIFQAFFNIASNLSIVPTKGMTLPFVSYGGSSFLSFAIIFGILLAILQEEKA
ncbi:MAG: FtsW/RodA/SpoVE family cell cycle protein [Alphaproteobacteria bacterium]|nr:MAG: hypothetical protein B6I23_03190 [Rickettsiaceae bacterium 4572_127]